jgi:hypothetical protein
MISRRLRGIFYVPILTLSTDDVDQSAQLSCHQHLQEGAAHDNRTVISDFLSASFHQQWKPPNVGGNAG